MHGFVFNKLFLQSFDLEHAGVVELVNGFFFKDDYDAFIGCSGVEDDDDGSGRPHFEQKLAIMNLHVIHVLANDSEGEGEAKNTIELFYLVGEVAHLHGFGDDFRLFELHDCGYE